MGFTEEKIEGLVVEEDPVIPKVEDQPQEPVKAPFRRQIVWFNAIGFLVLNLLMVYGLYISIFVGIKYQTWIWLIFVMHWAGVGVTMGAHRLWTHKSFKAKLPLKMFLLIGQTIAGQNCLWVWVRDHRLHHKYSDTDADPHNIKRGFFFSHMGWLMCRKHPDVFAKGKGIDMVDIEADPHLMFQKKYYKTLYFISSILFPVLVPVFFWDESLWNSLFTAYFFRNMLGLHLAWTVNSIAHMFGTRPYTKDMEPTDSLLVGWLAIGEGWHNYHHTFPWDCRAGEWGVTPNLTSALLEMFERMGQAYDLKRVPMSMVRQRALKKGDGSYTIHKD